MKRSSVSMHAATVNPKPWAARQQEAGREQVGDTVRISPACNRATSAHTMWPPASWLLFPSCAHAFRSSRNTKPTGMLWWRRRAARGPHSASRPKGTRTVGRRTISEKQHQDNSPREGIGASCWAEFARPRIEDLRELEIVQRRGGAEQCQTPCKQCREGPADPWTCSFVGPAPSISRLPLGRALVTHYGSPMLFQGKKPGRTPGVTHRPARRSAGRVSDRPRVLTHLRLLRRWPAWNAQ